MTDFKPFDLTELGEIRDRAEISANKFMVSSWKDSYYDLMKAAAVLFAMVLKNEPTESDEEAEVSVKDLKTSEILDEMGDINQEIVTEKVDELMGRFPFDSIGELEKRIDALEAKSEKLLNHIHSQSGKVYIIAE